jgi:hypothetical protein
VQLGHRATALRSTGLNGHLDVLVGHARGHRYALIDRDPGGRIDDEHGHALGVRATENVNRTFFLSGSATAIKENAARVRFRATAGRQEDHAWNEVLVMSIEANAVCSRW